MSKSCKVQFLFIINNQALYIYINLDNEGNEHKSFILGIIIHFRCNVMIQL